jgi:hypothetical protein
MMGEPNRLLAREIDAERLRAARGPRQQPPTGPDAPRASLRCQAALVRASLLLRPSAGDAARSRGR